MKNHRINYVEIVYTESTEAPSSANETAPFFNLFTDSIVSIVIQLMVIGIIILITVVGNAMVVIIVWKSKKLHNVGMFLIASLAVCDALVGIAVMPFKTAFQISGDWPFNRHLCQVWMFLDVSLCTASIWHLCAIGMDRLWIFSYELKYITKRNYKVTLSLLAVISALTFGISLPLLLYPWENRDQGVHCSIPDSIAFTLYSTFGAFYLPFIILVIIYLRMYNIARKRWRRKRQNSVPAAKSDTDQPKRLTSVSANNPRKLNSTAAAALKLSMTTNTATSSLVTNKTKSSNDTPLLTAPAASSSGKGVSPIFAVSRMRGRIAQWKKRAAEKRERRAIMTLFTILLTFAVCWLPFFLVALIVPFCGAKCAPHYVLSLFIDWLGYLNSTMNPIIYALMNDDLRLAFQELYKRST